MVRKHVSRRINVVALVLCASAVASADPNTSPDTPLVDPSGEMLIQGEVVYYSVAPRILDPKNNLQPVRLVTQDGRTWVRAYRGVAREYHLAGQWVRVWGHLFKPTTRVPKLVSGVHIRVERFEPIGDAFSTRVTRGGVPPLRTAQSMDELSGPRQRWVAVQGTLETVGLFSANPTTFATVRLRDGALIRVSAISQADADAYWRPLGGDDVTALVELKLSSPNTIHVLRTAGACEGFVSRCGLTPGQKLGPRSRHTKPKNPFRRIPKSGAGKILDILQFPKK